MERFRQLYPALSVEIVASNRYYDIIENGLDLAIRTRRVEADSSITIRRLAETRRLLAASPLYLNRRGTPKCPEELTAHDLILYTLADNWNEFNFRRGEEAVVVKVDGAIVANDGQLICEAARDGLGILAQPTYIIQKDLEAGRLVRVLDDWDLPRLTMNIAYPSKSFVPLRTRLFIDFLVERFGSNEFEKVWSLADIRTNAFCDFGNKVSQSAHFLPRCMTVRECAPIRRPAGRWLTLQAIKAVAAEGGEARMSQI